MQNRNKQYLLILGLVILVGIAIRSWELTARSLWFDEAFSWRLVQFSWTEMIARDAADVHPPLYYLILKAWSFIFGTTLLSLRSLSVLLAGTTIAATYFFTREAFRSRPIALSAALLIALSGFQIQFAWEARMYTLGTTLCLLTTWILLKAIRRPQLKTWLAYSVLTTAFAYTHYFAFFSLAAHFVFVIGYLFVQHKTHLVELISSKIFKYGLVAGLLALLLYSPWIPTFLAQNSQVQASFWIPPIGGWSIPDTFYRMFAPTSGIPRHLGLGWILLAAFPIFATCLGWIALILTGNKHPRANWLIVLSGLTPFLLAILLSFVGQSLYQDRFLVFAHLFIVIGLAALLHRIPFSKLKLAAVTLTPLLFAWASWTYWQELDIPNRPGARAATQFVYQDQVTADQSVPVLTNSPFIYFALLHYAQEEFSTQNLPKLYTESGELAHFAGGPILTSDDIVSPEILENPNLDQVWIIDTTGFGGQPLVLNSVWEMQHSQEYPEVFGHQGTVTATLFQR